ncbi:hypothetical protein MUK42_32899 [Musa troglodytarum]|uniref:Uncharacterized protein n=1 Tax=Musa troglodytarum TaxID=320322 RepID=A0A9E7F6G4_9LILI|nr:hypothetical protein MUK42_32899 [Musa troglodytarum]
MLTHSSCSSTSPLSTFRSRRTTSWATVPSFREIWLSSAKQFCLLGLTVVIMVTFGIPAKSILIASMNGRMSSSASPIISSGVNVSLS